MSKVLNLKTSGLLPASGHLLLGQTTHRLMLWHWRCSHDHYVIIDSVATWEDEHWTLVFLGLLSRNGSQVHFPTKPTIHIPFYNLGFCFRKNENELLLMDSLWFSIPLMMLGWCLTLHSLWACPYELVYKANLNTVWSTLEMPQFPLAGLGGPREPTVPTAHTWPLSSGWTTRQNSCLGLQTRLLL